MKPGFIIVPYQIVTLFGEEAEKYSKEFQATKKAKGLVTKEEWHKMHRACPVCGNTSLRITCAGPVDDINKDYSDDINYANCDEPGFFNISTFKGCGWSGKVNQLVEKL